MKDSNTNTAARELLTDAERGVIETLLNAVYAAWNLADSTEDAGDITSVTVERGHFEDLSERLDALDALPDDQPEYTMAAAAKARWALRRLLDPTLTQQQGGEQEADVEKQARTLLAIEYEREGIFGQAGEIRAGTEDVLLDEEIHLRAIVAALRTKQPAASEGDVEALARKMFTDQADKLAAPWDRQLEPTKQHWREKATEQLNTSKQAAGEAVVLERWGFPSGISSPAERCADGYWTPWHIAQSLLSTPPRHPADEGKDAARYRWLRKQHNESVTGVYVCDDQGLSIGMNLDDALDAAIIRAAP